MTPRHRRARLNLSVTRLLLGCVESNSRARTEHCTVKPRVYGTPVRAARTLKSTPESRAARWRLLFTPGGSAKLSVVEPARGATAARLGASPPGFRNTVGLSPLIRPHFPAAIRERDPPRARGPVVFPPYFHPAPRHGGQDPSDRHVTQAQLNNAQRIR